MSRHPTSRKADCCAAVRSRPASKWDPMRVRPSKDTRSAWGLALVAAAACLFPAAASNANPSDVEELLRASQAPALLISSTLPERSSTGEWELYADVLSDCVDDPAGARTCGAIELRLIYYSAIGSGAQREDVIEHVDPPYGACIPFTMRPGAYSYKFVARQVAHGPFGQAEGVAYDPVHGGTYPVPRDLQGLTLVC